MSKTLYGSFDVVESGICYKCRIDRWSSWWRDILDNVSSEGKDGYGVN